MSHLLPSHDPRQLESSLSSNSSSAFSNLSSFPRPPSDLGPPPPVPEKDNAVPKFPPPLPPPPPPPPPPTPFSQSRRPSRTASTRTYPSDRDSTGTTGTSLFNYADQFSFPVYDDMEGEEVYYGRRSGEEVMSPGDRDRVVGGGAGSGGSGRSRKNSTAGRSTVSRDSSYFCHSNLGGSDGHNHDGGHSHIDVGRGRTSEHASGSGSGSGYGFSSSSKKRMPSMPLPPLPPLPSQKLPVTPLLFPTSDSEMSKDPSSLMGSSIMGFPSPSSQQGPSSPTKPGVAPTPSPSDRDRSTSRQTTTSSLIDPDFIQALIFSQEVPDVPAAAATAIDNKPKENQTAPPTKQRRTPEPLSFLEYPPDRGRDLNRGGVRDGAAEGGEPIHTPSSASTIAAPRSTSSRSQSRSTKGTPTSTSPLSSPTSPRNKIVSPTLTELKVPEQTGSGGGSGEIPDHSRITASKRISALFPSPPVRTPSVRSAGGGPDSPGLSPPGHHVPSGYWSSELDITAFGPSSPSYASDLVGSKNGGGVGGGADYGLLSPHSPASLNGFQSSPLVGEGTSEEMVGWDGYQSTREGYEGRAMRNSGATFGGGQVPVPPSPDVSGIQPGGGFGRPGSSRWSSSLENGGESLDVPEDDEIVGPEGGGRWKRQRHRQDDEADDVSAAIDTLLREGLYNDDVSVPPSPTSSVSFSMMSSRRSSRSRESGDSGWFVSKGGVAADAPPVPPLPPLSAANSPDSNNHNMPPVKHERSPPMMRHSLASSVDFTDESGGHMIDVVDRTQVLQRPSLVSAALIRSRSSQSASMVLGSEDPPLSLSPSPSSPSSPPLVVRREDAGAGVYNAVNLVSVGSSDNLLSPDPLATQSFPSISAPLAQDHEGRGPPPFVPLPSIPQSPWASSYVQDVQDGVVPRMPNSPAPPRPARLRSETSQDRSRSPLPSPVREAPPLPPFLSSPPSSPLPPIQRPSPDGSRNSRKSNISNRTSHTSILSRLSRSLTWRSRSSRASHRSGPYPFSGPDASGRSEVPPLPFKEGGNGSGTSLGRFRREVAKHERELPLTDLIQRAALVSAMLDSGKQARSSIGHTLQPPGADMSNLSFAPSNPAAMRSGTMRTNKRSTGTGDSIFSRWSAAIRPSRSSERVGPGPGPSNARWSKLDEHPIPVHATSTERHMMGSRVRARNSLGNANDVWWEGQDDGTREKAGGFNQRPLPALPGRSSRKPLMSSRRFRLFLGIALAVLILAIVLGLALGLRNGSAAAAGNCSRVCMNGGRAVNSTSGCQCICTGSFTGAYCNLDATCTCPNGATSCGAPLAQALVDASSAASALFNPTIDTNAFATALARGNSSSTDGSCVHQAQLIDLPNLNPTRYPQRLAWSQAALAYNYAMTESFNDTLRSFAASLDFTSLGVGDSPSPSYVQSFEMPASGYVLDFAWQRLVLPTVSWASDSGASAAQSAALGANTLNTLNRMTSYAAAASTQRSNALSNYWTQTLNLPATDLPRFLDKVRQAPAVFPVDFTGNVGGQNTADLATSAASSNSSFPPPISCYSGLSSSQMLSINSVESDAFGLTAINSSATPTCSDRPLYGMLNLASLRTPFADTDPRTGLPKQGLVANEDVKSRLTMHGGELLAGLMSGTPVANASASHTPDRFGTMTHFDHVVLDYLSLFPSPSSATQLVQYVLGSSAPPSSPPSSLPANIPILEVQLWGGLYPSDLNYTISSFTCPTPTEALFFGSTVGDKFRSWVFDASKGPIYWAVNALGVTAATETALGIRAFDSVWNSVAKTSTTGALAGAAVLASLSKAGFVQ